MCSVQVRLRVAHAPRERGAAKCSLIILRGELHRERGADAEVVRNHHCDAGPQSPSARAAMIQA
jgi:hypothetical protein